MIVVQVIFNRMGYDISQSCTPPPLTLIDCLVDVQIDLARYRLCARRTCEDEDEYEDVHETRWNKRKTPRRTAKATIEEK